MRRQDLIRPLDNQVVQARGSTRPLTQETSRGMVHHSKALEEGTPAISTKCTTRITLNTAGSEGSADSTVVRNPTTAVDMAAAMVEGSAMHTTITEAGADGVETMVTDRRLYCGLVFEKRPTRPLRSNFFLPVTCLLDFIGVLFMVSVRASSLLQ